MTRTLVEFPTSPFSLRTRLALAHKGLTVTRVDGRAEPARLEQVRQRCPIRTVPILIEEDGSLLGDSTAISHYLDAAYPGAPRIWPADAHRVRATVEATALVDVALNTVVDVGTRYYALRDSPEWGAVKHEMVGRAQIALDALAAQAASRIGETWTGGAWSAADMWVTTATMWIQAWPTRTDKNPRIAQLLTLGLRLPDDLVRWTDAHRKGPQLSQLD